MRFNLPADPLQQPSRVRRSQSQPRLSQVVSRLDQETMSFTNKKTQAKRTVSRSPDSHKRRSLVNYPSFEAKRNVSRSPESDKRRSLVSFPSSEAKRTVSRSPDSHKRRSLVNYPTSSGLSPTRASGGSYKHREEEGVTVTPTTDRQPGQ